MALCCSHKAELLQSRVVSPSRHVDCNYMYVTLFNNQRTNCRVLSRDIPFKSFIEVSLTAGVQNIPGKYIITKPNDT